MTLAERKDQLRTLCRQAIKRYSPIEDQIAAAQKLLHDDKSLYRSLSSELCDCAVKDLIYEIRHKMAHRLKYPGRSERGGAVIESALAHVADDILQLRRGDIFIGDADSARLLDWSEKEEGFEIGHRCNREFFAAAAGKLKAGQVLRDVMSASEARTLMDNITDRLQEMRVNGRQRA